mgnify:CR=1 FL=1|jgi:hypothetical protein
MNQSLRCFLLGILLLGSINLPAQAGNREAPTATETSSSVVLVVEVGDLKDQLEKGLKARLPTDFAFIAKVILLVKTNKLPLPMVKAVFQWARERGAKTNYPFPYFERALKIRAKKLGIII